MSPIISVVMPAYNADRFIEESIRSVIFQTFTDWELLVIDDGSSDATCAVVERLAEKDPRIRLFRSEENMGVAVARNRGLSLASGAYIALLDSDDLWHPEKLAVQLEMIRRTGADVVYTSYGMIDEAGNKRYADFIVPETTDARSFLSRSVIFCSSALLSRKIGDTYRFDGRFYHEDMVFWLQILRDGCVVRGTAQVLAQYRVMRGTRSANKLRSAAKRWQVYRRFLGLSFWESLQWMGRYAFLALRKFRREHT